MKMILHSVKKNVIKLFLRDVFASEIFLRIPTIQTEVVLNVLLMEEMMEEMGAAMRFNSPSLELRHSLFTKLFHISSSHNSASCQTCTNRRS